MSLINCISRLGFDGAEAAKVEDLAVATGGDIEGVRAYIRKLAADREALRSELLDQGVDVEVREEAPELYQSAAKLGFGLSKKNKHQLAPYLREKADVKKSELPDKPSFVQTTTNKNAQAQIDAIDSVLSNHPDAHESADLWARMMAEAFADNDVPAAPHRFLKDIRDGGSIATLSKLTPGQVADADHGFENAARFREKYIAGELGVETTGKLFLWSFLSRGVSPYAQESLFIDAFDGIEPYFDAAARGDFNLEEYLAWSGGLAGEGSGQPGAGASHNLNAFGRDFLTKMSVDIGDGSGRSRLQYLHDLMSDPNMTGKEIRRRFATFGEGVGIDNKVVSFTLLVVGFDDIMVLDRVQIRQLWDDGRFNSYNLYDGVKVPSAKDPTKSQTQTGTSLAKLTEGVRGIFVYEAIERALSAKINDIYTAVGRPESASIGRYHWETWVSDSAQEASHGTLDAILQDAAGVYDAINQVTAKQGEYGMYAYGARYGVDGRGVPYFNYTAPDGKTWVFTVPNFVKFLQSLSNPSVGVVPASLGKRQKKDKAGKLQFLESGEPAMMNIPFTVAKRYELKDGVAVLDENNQPVELEELNAPWYTRSEVNEKAINAVAASFAEGVAGDRAGTVRGPSGDENLSDRSPTDVGVSSGFAADQTELFQGAPERQGLDRLYNPVIRAVQDMDIPEWKAKKPKYGRNAQNEDEQLDPEAKGTAIWAKLKKWSPPPGSSKKDALKWTGIEEFLTVDPDKKFSRQEVVDFLKNGGVFIDEVIASNDPDQARASQFSDEATEDRAPVVNFDFRQEMLDRSHPLYQDELNRQAENIEEDVRHYLGDLEGYGDILTGLRTGPSWIAEEVRDAFIREFDQLGHYRELTFAEVQDLYVAETGDAVPTAETQTLDMFEPDADKALADLVYRQGLRFSEWLDTYLEEEEGTTFRRMIDDTLSELADQRTEERQLTRWYDSDTDTEIVGSQEDPDMGFLVNGRWTAEDSFEDAVDRAREQAIENGTFGEGAASIGVVPKWETYVTPGSYNNYREYKIVLPKIEGDFYYDTHYPDRNIVAFNRVTDREALPSQEEMEAEAARRVEIVELTREEFEALDRFDPMYSGTDLFDDRFVEQTRERFNEPGDVPGDRVWIAVLDGKPVLWNIVSEAEVRRRATDISPSGDSLLRSELLKNLSKQVYVLEESQSDWHQRGRQYGYKPDLTPEQLTANQERVTKLEDEAFRLILDENFISNEQMTFLTSLIENTDYTGNIDPDDPRPAVHAAMEGKAIYGTVNFENDAQRKEFFEKAKQYREMIEPIDQYFSVLEEAGRLHRLIAAEESPLSLPDAPFSADGWISLGLKRALIDAAERGHDKFAWPNSQVLVERWSESTRESYEIQYDDKMPSLIKKLTGQEIYEASLDKFQPIAEETEAVTLSGDDMIPRHQSLLLPSVSRPNVYIGGTPLGDATAEFHAAIKDMENESLPASQAGIIMNRYYAADDALNDALHEAGVHQDILVTYSAGDPRNHIHVMVQSRTPDGRLTGATTVGKGTSVGAALQTARHELNRKARKSDKRVPHWYVIDLPPELREKILNEGFSMFQEEGTSDPTDPLGVFNPETGDIRLFENANMSTLLHEMGHFFVEMLGRMAAREGASQRVQDNYKAMLEWVGAESAEDLNVRINGQAARDKQEKLAEAFEAYLKEGKAPSLRLQNAFAAFRQWLLRTYQRILGIEGVQIDDEIRAVFDRMLATDREIAEMKAVNSFDMSSPSILALMSDEERPKYSALMDDADEVARNEAVQAQNEAAARADQDWWKQALKKMKTAVEKELYTANAPYRALYFLTRGKFRSGETPAGLINKKISKQGLLDMGLTQEQLNDLPRHGATRIYTNGENGVDPEIMAAALNFASAQEMVEVMTNMLPAKEAIDRGAEMQMRADHGDPLNDGTIEKLAGEKLYNDTRRRAIEMELDALATATGQQKVGKAVVKAMVDRIFNEMPVGELLTPMKYQAASVRAAREAERAAAAGDNMLAFEKKRQQLLNHELFRRGLQARDEVEKITKKLRGYQNKKIDAKKVDPDHVAQVKNLLMFYELGNMSLKKFEENSAATASSIMQFIELQRAAGEPIVMPGDLVEVVGFNENGEPKYAFKTTHWRQMTMAEIKGLRDMADNLMKIGRDNSEAERERRRLEAENLAASIDRNTRPRKVRDKKLIKPEEKTQRRKINVESWFAGHRKLESMVRQLDGFQEMGPAWREIFQDLADAQNEKMRMVRESLDALSEIFRDYTLKERMMGGTQKIDALGVSITRDQAMTLLLNWGNESSREAVLEDRFMKEQYGDRWNEETIMSIFEQVLTEKDLKAINEIWEYIDSFWPQVAALEREDTGVVAPKVEAEAFFVGQTRMRGGYYPLKYDNLNDSRVAIEKQNDINVGVMSGGFARAQTSHGHTNARVGSGGRPVRLDFSVLSEHLEEVTQDLAYRKAVRKVDQIFKQPSIRDAIVKAMGQAHYDDMVNVLTAVAGAHIVDKPTGPVKALQWARMSTTIAVMGWNLKSILSQPFGLTQSIARIGEWATIDGVIEFYMNPIQMREKIRQIHAKSEYMRDRSRTMTREIEETLNAINPPNVSDTLTKVAFAPMILTDVYGVAGPTWLGAYNKALAGKVENIEAGNEIDAVRFADAAVRQSQGSGGALNLSNLQQQGEIKKLLTMFYGYFNTTYNMMAEAVEKSRLDGGVKGASHLAAQTMYLIILPAIMGGLMLEKWPDEEDTDEDPEKAWLKWSMIQIFNYATGTLVLGRDVGRALTSGFDFSLTPITGFFGNMTKFVVDAGKIAMDYYEDGELEDGIPDSAVKNAGRFFGTLMRMPGTFQIVRMVDTWIKTEEGTLKNEPRNELERAQKLLFTGDR